MILMIDNFDSFTFNIVQYFWELEQEVKVYRNDAITIEVIEQLDPDYIVLSPGPGRPQEAGITLDVLANFYDKKPILGICLGHQSIAEFFGGDIVLSSQLVHGKTSSVYHHESGIFKGLPSPYAATRYHSLVIDKATLPDCLQITAWTQTTEERFDDIMGIQHKTLPVMGVQFHPEAILSQHGHALLKNFLQC